jgi:hypothetical protein
VSGGKKGVSGGNWGVSGGKKDFKKLKNYIIDIDQDA